LCGRGRRRRISIAARVSSNGRGEAADVNRREERSRYLTIFLVTAPGSAAVWFVFHGVYESLTASEKAVGYVDPLTQIFIGLGYVAMIGGTLVLGAIAAWSGIKYLRLIARDR
jgi:hypothetical protein